MIAPGDIVTVASDLDLEKLLVYSQPYRPRGIARHVVCFAKQNSFMLVVSVRPYDYDRFYSDVLVLVSSDPSDFGPSSVLGWATISGLRRVVTRT